MATITGGLQANLRVRRKEYVDMVFSSVVRAEARFRLQPGGHRALGTMPCDGLRVSAPSFAGAAGILVADGDSTTRHQIVSYLREQDMTAVAASGRDDLMSRLIANQPALVIFDLQIGKNDGLDVLREIQSRSGVAVITIGHPCDEIDPVIGLELGADDYLPKPFGLRELLARIRAILRRRSSGQSTSGQHPKTGRCRFGGWQLDRRTRRLTGPDGNPVALTKREYALLLGFLCAPQRPLGRQSLLQATNVREDVLDRTVDVQILRLRRKLEVDPGTPPVIKTERGVGYVFTLPVEELDHGVPRRVKPDLVDRQT
jgi:two-component system, OmpR family, response regulator